MSKDEMGFEELMNLEGRLRRAEAITNEQESLSRVLRKVQAHVNATPAAPSRKWGRRLSMFAVVGIPAAAAAAIAGILLHSANPQRAVVPAPNSTPSVAPSPEPSASPAPPPEQLLVLTQRANGNLGNIIVGVAPDAVILAKLDGTVVARATFKPATEPLITNAATILPPQVHAAAGAAYYIDGDGTVRRLDRAGAVTTVASFPTTEPQHMTSFAVSPDGSKVMASVFTFGAKGPGLPGPITLGPSYDNLEYADAGGQTKVLSHTPLASTEGHFMVVGWDQNAPLAGTAVPIATQNPVHAGWNSALYHLDLAGNQTDRLGGSDCVAEFASENGYVVCGGTIPATTTVQVRTASGTLVYGASALSTSYDSAAISPDGSQLAIRETASRPAAGTPRTIVYSVGFSFGLPNGFYLAGWPNNETLAGYTGDLNNPTLATISTANGGQDKTVRPFPVNGTYAGSIPAG